MVYIVVYVGAIAILFLFVVMMLNIKLLEIKENFWVYTPLVFIIGAVLTGNFVYLFRVNSPDNTILEQYTTNDTSLLSSSISNFNTLTYTDWVSAVLIYENIQSIGLVLYSYYSFAFILLSFLLLIAMMGSIILTLKESVVNKRQNIFKQTQNDFVKTINMR